MVSVCDMPAVAESRWDEIELDAKPDVMGMGRVIVNGKYFGLPASAVAQIERWRDNQDDGYDHWD